MLLLSDCAPAEQKTTLNRAPWAPAKPQTSQSLAYLHNTTTVYGHVRYSKSICIALWSNTKTYIIMSIKIVNIMITVKYPPNKKHLDTMQVVHRKGFRELFFIYIR